jgi:hypothetical protein
MFITMKQNSYVALYAPSGYKVLTVSPKLDTLGYLNSVVSNRQGVLIITENSTHYFSMNQQFTLSVDWNGKLSWLQRAAKFPSISLIVVSHSQEWMILELTRKLNVPVMTMNTIDCNLNVDEVYSLLNAYINHVSKGSVPVVKSRVTYVKAWASRSSKFKASRRTAKVLVRTNYPFASHTGSSFRRARVSGRLPKP